MSGFFMLRRDKFDEVVPRLSPAGFKILLDIVTASDRLRVAEQPFVFGTRHAGESKFNAQVGLEFLGLLLAKLSGGFVDPRFIFFLIVGALGLLVHLAVLKAGLISLAFPAAQSIATFAAMTSNFFLNNTFTYADQRVRGRQVWRGLLSFYLACGIGSIVNLAVAEWLYLHSGAYWLAGIIGALTAAFWNFFTTASFTWGAAARSRE
jgi:dolichol-phosphate mannosyltransferase